LKKKASSFAKIRAELSMRQPIKIVPCGPPGIGAEKSGKFLRTASEVLTMSAVLLSNVLS
jgi:hypothetical protein